GPVELLEKEADPGLVRQLLLVLGRRPVPDPMLVLRILLDQGLLQQVLADVAEVEPRRVLQPPVVERRANRLGALEPGDRVTAEAPQPRDGPLAQVHQLLRLAELPDERVDLAQ